MGSEPEGLRKEGAPVVFAAGVGGQVTNVVPSGYHGSVRGSSETGERDIPGRSASSSSC